MRMARHLTRTSTRPGPSSAATTTRGHAVSGCPSSPDGSRAVTPRSRADALMRAELEKLIGAASVDERQVRDMWPLSLMEIRDGNTPPRVLVARPAGREQLAAVLRWASSKGM